MPLAAFVHAREYSDIAAAHFEGKATVVLVDPVINTEASIREFVEPLRNAYPQIKIVVVAGVVQEEAVREMALGKMLEEDTKMWLVALRMSGNRFVGKGKTGAGDWLFGTTYLE
jgi:uracil phosphoribosyltransferase